MRKGFYRLTEGERSFALAHLAMAVFGAGLAFSAVTQINDGAWLTRPISNYEGWILACGAVGGVSGLFLCRDKVGQAGPLRAAGWLAAVNVIAAVIAGSLALPLYGTMFGPFAMIVILAGSPLLGILWLANLLVVHLLLARFHAERDSIFRAVPRASPATMRA